MKWRRDDMRSIKPGRGPSAMGGVGSVVAAVFGVFWTAMAASSGAPAFFVLFGVIFVIMGIVQAVYQFNNAAGKNRYSAFDIMDSNEEPDPLQEMVDRAHGIDRTTSPSHEHRDGRFCPYCGAEAPVSYSYCEKCGKKLP